MRDAVPHAPWMGSVDLRRFFLYRESGPMKRSAGPPTSEGALPGLVERMTPSAYATALGPSETLYSERILAIALQAS